jgi:hypothetical protein
MCFEDSLPYGFRIEAKRLSEIWQRWDDDDVGLGCRSAGNPCKVTAGLGEGREFRAYARRTSAPASCVTVSNNHRISSCTESPPDVSCGFRAQASSVIGELERTSIGRPAVPGRKRNGKRTDGQTAPRSPDNWIHMSRRRTSTRLPGPHHHQQARPYINPMACPRTSASSKS